MKTIQAPWIKLKEHLDQEDYNLISSLQEKCIITDKIALKLELDYKLAAALESIKKSGMREVNEFMYFDGQQLIGYIGIGSFGGAGAPLEITGMVHPDYRRLGIFTILNDLVKAECKRRNSGNVLVLCDKKSASGQRFVEKIGAVYSQSEFEMYLQQDYPGPNEKQLCGVSLRKAKNSDAYEVSRQNAIYFGDTEPHKDSDFDLCDSNTFSEKCISKDDLLLPEEEEKRGMTIYLALHDNQIIGKVHLETNTTVGGIYGLGVLPEYRGKGFGRAILLRGIEKLKEGNVQNIMLQVTTENATALNLYKSCGFVETSTMDYFELIP